MAGPIRQPIDQNALERYFEKNVPEIRTPLDIKQFGFGQSNPTYLLTSLSSSPSSPQHHVVLRKKPPGKLLSKTAHQVEREFQILDALSKHTDVPVPKTYVLCEDESVIGTKFYVMEYLEGRMITEPWIPEVGESEREEMWKSAVLTLAKLHSIDPASIGLSSFGKPSGFYTRQIKTLSTISHSQAEAINQHQKANPSDSGSIPHFDSMIQFFSDATHQPRDRACLMHGDYKIDNLVFHPTLPQVIGILDWELATIGHPLADLVNLTGPYTWGKGSRIMSGSYNNNNNSTNAPPYSSSSSSSSSSS